MHNTGLQVTWHCYTCTTHSTLTGNQQEFHDITIDGYLFAQDISTSPQSNTKRKHTNRGKNGFKVLSGHKSTVYLLCKQLNGLKVRNLYAATHKTVTVEIQNMLTLIILYFSI